MNPLIRIALVAVLLFPGASCGGTTLDLGERASPADAGAPKADAAPPPSDLSAFERACAAPDTTPVIFTDSSDARKHLIGTWYLCPNQTGNGGLVRKDFAAIEFSPGTSCPTCFSECRVFVDKDGVLAPIDDVPTPCVATTGLNESARLSIIIASDLECTSAECTAMRSSSRFDGVLEIVPDKGAKLLLRSHVDLNTYGYYTLASVPGGTR